MTETDLIGLVTSECDLSRIVGLEGLTAAEIEKRLAEGQRIVFYEYCISFLIATARWPSRAYFLGYHESGTLKGLPYALISFLFGWWGLPWGPICTLQTIKNNLCGGNDITEEVRRRFLAEKTID